MGKVCMSNPSNPILLADDEAGALLNHRAILEDAGYHNILSCADGEKILPILSAEKIELLLFDFSMHKGSGKEILEYMKVRFPEVPVILVTTPSNVETAIECLQVGVLDYLVKPVEKNRLVSAVRRALELRTLQRERLTAEDLRDPSAFAAIITESGKMKSLFRLLEVVAATREPLLILGETGTGKELLARALHRISGGRGELVALNIAGLDETMLSDTLFGHRRGAFTGASESRRGLLAAAEGGSLFFDEIGDISQAIQAKLLRLIETGEYYPLGSDEAHGALARFLFATNRDLRRMTEEGNFRKDLYFRLAMNQIRLPPLRERKEDILPLFNHFLREAGRIYARKVPRLQASTEALLLNYDFPGNVRELRSFAFSLVSGTCSVFSPLSATEAWEKAFPRPTEVYELEKPSLISSGADGLAFFPTLREETRRLIAAALEKSGGNIREAARLLGISHQALSKRLKRDRKNFSRYTGPGGSPDGRAFPAS